MTPDTPALDRVAYILEEMRRLRVRVIARNGYEYVQALSSGLVEHEEDYEGVREVPDRIVVISPSDCEGVD